MSDSEYSEIEYGENEMIYNELHKFNYFSRCDKCQLVKEVQKILLNKCDVLHNLKSKIVDYYGCDKCCKLRNMFDEYICPFTKLCKYPEYDEVHKIMQDDVQKKDYTLELHSEMKTIYENLDIFDFYTWHLEKKNYYKDTLCGYANYYQRVHHIFIKIIYYLKSANNNNISFEILYEEEATEFLNQMIVQNSI